MEARATRNTSGSRRGRCGGSVDLIRGRHVDEARRVLQLLARSAPQRRREAAELRRRQRRAAARRDRGEPVRGARLGRRGADAQAVPPARLRPRDADPQADVARDSSWRRWERRAVGHKVNPYGFRLGVIYPWKSQVVRRARLRRDLHQDILIRKYIRAG